MYSILNSCHNEIIIKNSRFITYLYYISSSKEVPYYLDKLKKEYKDASHYCFCYITLKEEKAFDDNEPNKTAGIPMLEILRKKQLTNVLAITIRYFGGIKLGSGGLIRSYAQSVKDCLKKTEIVSLKKGYAYQIRISYTLQKRIDLLLTKAQNIQKEYKEDILISFTTAHFEVIDFIEHHPDIQILEKKEILIRENPSKNT